MSSVNVLIVEDDKFVIDSLMYLLRENDFTVVASLTISDAIKQVQESSPDLIIADYRLGHVQHGESEFSNPTDGRELFSYLRNNLHWDGIFVLFTAFIDAADRIDLPDKKFFAFSKFENPTTLLKFLKKILNTQG